MKNERKKLCLCHTSDYNIVDQLASISAHISSHCSLRELTSLKKIILPKNKGKMVLHLQLCTGNIILKICNISQYFKEINSV